MKARIPATWVLAAGVLMLLFFPLKTWGSNVDETSKWGWSGNSGWLDFRPAEGGVTVYDTHLSGYAYSEKIGWVSLGSSGGTPDYANTDHTDWGVNNDSDGNLSGYGWVTNAGWINFSSGDYPGRVVIDSEGNFSGYAFSEKVGWVNFSSLGPVDYRVVTEWTPAKKILVETADDGSGTVVGEQSIASGDSIAVYAITRDDNGTFKENINATWSLVSIGGDVVQGDLVDNEDGSATLTGNLIGSAKIKAEYEELEATSSGLITVTFGEATELAIAQQPGGATAGAALDPQPKVVVRDAAGNTVTDADDQITASIVTNPSGDGELLGTTQIVASAGEAQFTDLKIDQAGAGYTLKFTGAGLESLETGTFNISAGPPTQLVFHLGPSETTAGEAISPAVKVRILDEQGNLTSADHTVTIDFNDNPHGGTISGTKEVGAVGGEAVFDDLWIDRAGTGYTLKATASGLSDAVSGSFEITIGPAAQLAFDQQPTEATAGEAISPAVTVRVEDSQGNLTGSTAEVTVAIENNPGGGTLDGTETVAASGGLATFSNLSIDKAGAGYTLEARAGSLDPDISADFDIVAGAAVKLSFDQQPTETRAGVAISPAVTVRIEDSLGNLVDSAETVEMAIEDNAAGDGEISGTLEVGASAGVASFSSLKINRPGESYTLRASGDGLTGAVSGGFNIIIGDPAQLVFQDQPTTTTVGETISEVRVRIEDSEGNLTGSTAEVTIAIDNNPSGGSLSGTNPTAASAGVAEFDDLSIDTPGTGYTLKATSGVLTEAISQSLNINPLGTGNIDWEDKWAWGENSGWLDFRPPAGGVEVYDTHLSGCAYSDKIGWVNLGSSGGTPDYANTDHTNWGVNNDGEGNLSGYGWVTNAGWINFSSGDYPGRVVIDSGGNFSGYAFSEKVGWVNFSSAGPVEYQVRLMDVPDILAISCYEDSVHSIEIAESTWQNVGTVSFSWTDPETPEGDTFYYLFDDSSGVSISATGDNAGGTVTTAYFNDYELPEEGLRYFHVKPRNSYGQWGDERVFNIKYDGTGPAAASGGASETHSIGVWSKNSLIAATWAAAVDEYTGVAGYSTLWDVLPDTLPDAVQDRGAEERSSTSPSQSTSDSIYLHIRAVDGVGNWSEEAYHYGPFSVDVDLPGEVSDLSAVDRPVQTWSNQSAVTFSWTDAVDLDSGIGGYAIGIDTSASGWLGTEKDVEAGVGTKTVHFPDGDENYFHIRALDNVGNWSQTAVSAGPFWIDTVGPVITEIRCYADSTETGQVPEAFWKAETTPYFTWDEPISDSPIAGYRYALNEELSGDFTLTDNFVDYDSSPLEEGQHVFRVQAKDAAGNEGAVKIFNLYVGEAETPVIRLVIYLHGYLDEETLAQRETLVNLEFREEIDISTTYYYDVNLGVAGMVEAPLSGLPAESYYILVRHKLEGNTFDGEPIPLGANHLPMISAGAVALSTVDVVEINFSDQLSGSFVEAYQSSDPDASSPMLAVTGHDERYLMLGGGNADGSAVINITDILKWDTLVGFPDSDHRGGARFSDEGNFNGDDVIDGHDFNIWKRMQSLGVTYAPLP